MRRISISKPDDPAQSARFRELAKELGADTPADALKASVKRLAGRPPEPRRKVGKAAKASKKR